MTQPPEQPPTEHTPPQGQPPQGQPWGQGQPQQWPVAPPPPPGAGPGQGPYHPPGGGYGAPSPYQQPSSGGSGKTIAIIVGIIVLVVLLFCGGVIALIAWGVNNVEDAIDDYDPGRSGGRDNPITVEQGEAFEVDGIEYADGWRIQPPADEYSGDTITGLKGTNDRDDESSKSVYLTFTFVDDDDTEVGQITCNSDGSITHGNAEELECYGADKITAPYDHIEVSAS